MWLKKAVPEVDYHLKQNPLEHILITEIEKRRKK